MRARAHQSPCATKSRRRPIGPQAPTAAQTGASGPPECLCSRRVVASAPVIKRRPLTAARSSGVRAIYIAAKPGQRNQAESIVARKVIIAGQSFVLRRSDVLKALALGARVVFVGRPFVYAASIAGEAGVGHAIRLLTAEISRNMAMLGVNRLDELDPRVHLAVE